VPGPVHVVVVGAGITGLLTGVRCAVAGHRVTVLDRGPIPNPEATSYDRTRVFRAFEPQDPAATALVASADRLWRELETVLGTGFYRRVGVVRAWPATLVASSAADCGVRLRIAEPGDYPHLGFPAGTVPVLELDAGILLAEDVLRAAAGWLARHPSVTLGPGRRVTALDAHSGAVRLADGTELAGELTVVAAGPWSADLVDVPVVLHRQTTVHLRPPTELMPLWRSSPAAGRLGADGRGWLVPPVDGDLVKLSSAAACRTVPSMSAPCGDAFVPDLLAGSAIRDLERYEVVKVEHGHYTVDSRTGSGRLVRVGPAVLARAATGGDGFRTAPLAAARIAQFLEVGR
jgi:glycine/D-amino acid oxidase-like deaminating enzyme